MKRKLFISSFGILLICLYAYSKTSYQVYRMPSSGNVAGWGPIDVSQSGAAVTGILGVANGGTGNSTGAIPAGTVLDFAGTAAPAGFLNCDGSAVSRTTYSNLFAAVGTTWGVGDGSTTFNLPGLSRRVTMGSGGTGTGTIGNAVGNTGGSETHTMTLGELVAHNHTGTATVSPIDIITENSSVNPGTAISLSGSYPQRVAVNSATTGFLSQDIIVPNGSYPLTINNTGSTTPFSIVQTAAIMLKIIKY